MFFLSDEFEDLRNIPLQPILPHIVISVIQSRGTSTAQENAYGEGLCFFEAIIYNNQSTEADEWSTIKIIIIHRLDLSLLQHD